MEPSYIYILLGIALLVGGRKLYWLSIGVLGFFAGAFVAARYVPAHPEWMTYVIAFGFGILGAIAAVMLQKIAIAALGFFAGGFLLANLFQNFHWTNYDSFLIPFLIGGALGAIVLIYIFDWALIVSSSIGGSYLVVRELHVSHSSETILFVLLAVVGVVIQSSMKKKKSRKDPWTHARREREKAADSRTSE